MFYSFLSDHGELEPESKCFTNTGVLRCQNLFISNFYEVEWIFPMAINLVHESIFSIFGL